MAEERKLVTILFADVTGSTALGEALDPEDTRALMARYYGHARQVIASHGGTLEKFIGDAVMAVFGLPQAHGNDAERALAAALALRVAVSDDPLLTERLVLRIGVNTGEVVATRDPSAGDFLVTGDAVNVAARLQQAATPGDILVGERTQTAGHAAFSFAEALSVEVRGKRQPLTIFPLVGPRPIRVLSRPPLVGRKRELAQLGLLRDAALEERHPQLISIVAPAGTGKTRLLEEFLSKRKRTQGWQVATARCLPYGQSLTYWPLRGLLDELLGAPFSPERVRAAYVAGGQTDEDAERLAGLLMTSLGVEAGDEKRVGNGRETDLGLQVERESAFAAWRLFVEALARQAPRIVIFEDLHWASDSLLDLVEHVTHPRTQAALLIVVLSRPELLDRRPGWGGGTRNFTVLSLNALGAQQTRKLVDQLAPTTATEGVRDRIVERSGGNPFFAIELSRGLAERLAERLDEAAITAGAGAPPEALPDTVHEAVLARLDLLTEPEREVLQVAAVAGRAFRPPTLRAALPRRAPATIGTALEALLARDIVAPAEGEEGAYTFRHILFRDVAYGTLARPERVRLHLAVAEWLEEFAGDRVDEFVELLAYHYREAVTLARQSAVPLEVEVDAARAVRYLERAGELAGHAGLLAAAIGHLRAALALAPAEEHLRLCEQLGDCAWAGDPAVEAYRRALDLWREGTQPDPLTGARLLRKFLIVYWGWAANFIVALSPEESAALHAEALQLAEEAGDEDELWLVRIAPLNAFMRPGSREEREGERDVCAAAVAHFERRTDWPALYLALDSYAAYAQVLGAHEEALAASQRCLEWPNLPWWAHANALCMIVSAYSFRSDYDACLAAAREALAQVRPGDPVSQLANAMSTAALAAYLSGRWSELEWVREALALMWEEAQQVPGLVRNIFWVGALPMLAAAVAREDRAAADAAAALMERTLYPAHPQTPGLRSIVAAYLADDPARLDLEALAQLPGVSGGGLLFFVERGLPAPAWLIQRAWDQGGDRLTPLAELAEALTSSDGARLAAAIDAAEAGHLVPLAARMRIVLAQRTGDAAQLARARPVLERLGDRQFLRRLEEVAAALKESA
jgi:class 3 adenylate cyclase